MQDFTGVPVVVDLAAMRDTVKKAGGDPKKINPLVPVDLVIDHSVMVDAFGTPEALEYNTKVEFERNEERYRFLRWAQTAFDNFRAVPPAQVSFTKLTWSIWHPLPLQKQSMAKLSYTLIPSLVQIPIQR